MKYEDLQAEYISDLEHKSRTAICIIAKWVDSIDAANNLINHAAPNVKQCFYDRTCADTYQSMQDSPLYLEAKEFLSLLK